MLSHILQGILVHFKPSNTFRKRLFHPMVKQKDISKHKLNNIAHAVQCSEECSDLCIGETKNLLHRHMHNTEGSAHQDNVQLCIYIWRTRDTHLTHLDTQWTMQTCLTEKTEVWERSEGDQVRQKGKTLIKQGWWSNTSIISHLHCTPEVPSQAFLTSFKSCLS